MTTRGYRPSTCEPGNLQSQNRGRAHSLTLLFSLSWEQSVTVPPLGHYHFIPQLSILKYSPFSLLPSLVTRPTWIIRPQMIMLHHMQMALCSVQSIFMAIISLSASQLIWEAAMITPILQKKN